MGWMITLATVRKFFNRDFTIRKLGWSVYKVDHREINGIFRAMKMVAVVYRAAGLTTKQMTNPQTILVSSADIVMFENLGPKGLSNPVPLEDLSLIPKEDVTSYVTMVEEPYSEYLVTGNPPLTIRIQSLLTRMTLLKGRFNSMGDPVPLGEMALRILVEMEH